jgi:hypothetical protein
VSTTETYTCPINSDDEEERYLYTSTCEKIEWVLVIEYEE